MFNRKFWKRGDKLTVKELNRLEKGVADLADSVLITVDEDVTNGMENLTFSNWSINVDQLREIIDACKKINLIVNVVSNNQTVSKYYLLAQGTGPEGAEFAIYIKGFGMTLWVLGIKKTEGDDEIEFDMAGIAPDVPQGE